MTTGQGYEVRDDLLFINGVQVEYRESPKEAL